MTTDVCENTKECAKRENVKFKPHSFEFVSEHL